MRKPARKRKNLDYPDETIGSRWATEARRLSSKMTTAERAEHFRQAMVKIYGGE
jgi:Mg/Co/Ni transporter MgtE